MNERISRVLKSGPATAQQICDATGLTQTTVAKYLRTIPNFIKISNRRPPLYAMTRQEFGSYEHIPIFSVDTDGHPLLIAHLRPLSPTGYKVDLEIGAPDILLGASGEGIYKDLPFFLHDLRPQGYIGKQIAKDLSDQGADFPNLCEDWDSRHIGRYLLANSSDLPGNLKLGIDSISSPRTSPRESTPEDYPRLAELTSSGQITGSSAGGEQPKFTAYNRNRKKHVIVKFSPAEKGPVSDRWRDILITEHVAGQILRDFGISAANTKIYEFNYQLFLESDRIDRFDEFGRRPLLSLSCVKREFVPRASNWVEVVTGLVNQNLINPQSLLEVEMLSYFGRLINNNDMHLGNLSVGYEGSTFTLMPVYDMGSMGFRPHQSGMVEPYSYKFKTPEQEFFVLKIKEIDLVKKVANSFWTHVNKHPLISDQLKRFTDTYNPKQLYLPGLEANQI